MEVWKFLHILGVVFMVGNVITTGLWAHWAVRTGDKNTLAFASNSILKADIFLTFVGGGLILIPGFVMLHHMKLTLFQLPWLVHGTVALALSTLMWLVLLLPDQFKMQKASKQGDLEKFK